MTLIDLTNVRNVLVIDPLAEQTADAGDCVGGACHAAPAPSDPEQARG